MRQKRLEFWIACLGLLGSTLGCNGEVSPSQGGGSAPGEGDVVPSSAPVPPSDLPSVAATPPPPIPGDVVSLHSADDANARRQALIQFLWGSDGFPLTRLPASVDKDISSPVHDLGNLERVDMLHFLDEGVESFGYHFIPLDGKQNRLVILHQGHSTILDDDPTLDDVSQGMQRTINNLLTEGYSVLAMYMPGCLPPASACDIPHATIVETPTTGSGIKFFLEPVALALNYMQTQSGVDGFTPYRDFSMVGLSGGGWTTTVYSAVDPRITLSIPVAGSLPLPLRTEAGSGDEEQTYPALYAIADYPDLYVLGAFGTNRSQVQVLNRHDNCCFGESPTQFDEQAAGQPFDGAVRTYEGDVRRSVEQIGSGSFRLEIDEAAPAHMISWNTIASVMLPELKAHARLASSSGSSGDTFIRGSSGTLIHQSGDTQEDTGIPMVGRPAWIESAPDQFDIFARDPANHLIHGAKRNTSWTVEELGAVVITDPVVVDPGAQSFDVVALTPDYLPNHWWQALASWSSEVVAAAPKTFGAPTLGDSVPGYLDLYARDRTHAPFHLRDDGTGAWTLLPRPQKSGAVGPSAQ